MKSRFWKALDALGASGSALSDWSHHLGDEFSNHFRFLRPTGVAARFVIVPTKPTRRWMLMDDGGVDYVAVHDDPSIPPIPYSAADVAAMEPCWNTIASALAELLGFDHGTWENNGHIRRIGSSQDPFGRVTPVLLFLPLGHLGDYQSLFRELSMRKESMVLLPSQNWLTEEIEALRIRNRHEFVTLPERLEALESQPSVRTTLPVIALPRRTNAPKLKAVLHAGHGLTWSQVTIEIMGNRTIRLTAPGQEGSYTFPKSQQLTPTHPLGILMKLAANGAWQNPRRESPDYERVSKAFRRCQDLLRSLVPLPGKPFRKATGAFAAVFQAKFNQKM
jgi:hypothetical protein